MPAVIAHPLEIKENVKDLYIQGLPPSIIAKKTGIKLRTIDQWITRGEWKPTRDAGITVAVLGRPENTLTNESTRARKTLSTILLKQLDKLSTLRVTANNLRNSKDAQGLAAVVKTIAEGCEIAYGWRQDDKPGTVVFTGQMPSSPDPVANARPAVVSPLPETSLSDNKPLPISDITPTPNDPTV